MLKPDSILIVDDNAADIILAKKAIAMSRPGCSIEYAYDGGEAIDLLQERDLPSLIFLDYNMPGINGIEFLQAIRKSGTTRYLPVVMLSSSIHESDIKESYDAGANSYLNKTLDFPTFTEEIRAVLHYWLDLNRSPNYAS
jgi:two-component system response regulator